MKVFIQYLISAKQEKLLTTLIKSLPLEILMMDMGSGKSIAHLLVEYGLKEALKALNKRYPAALIKPAEDNETPFITAIIRNREMVDFMLSLIPKEHAFKDEGFRAAYRGECRVPAAARLDDQDLAGNLRIAYAVCQGNRENVLRWCERFKQVNYSSAALVLTILRSGQTHLLDLFVNTALTKERLPDYDYIHRIYDCVMQYYDQPLVVISNLIMLIQDVEIRRAVSFLFIECAVNENNGESIKRLATLYKQFSEKLENARDDIVGLLFRCALRSSSDSHIVEITAVVMANFSEQEELLIAVLNEVCVDYLPFCQEFVSLMSPSQKQALRARLESTIEIDPERRKIISNLLLWQSYENEYDGVNESRESICSASKTYAACSEEMDELYFNYQEKVDALFIPNPQYFFDMAVISLLKSQPERSRALSYYNEYIRLAHQKYSAKDAARAYVSKLSLTMIDTFNFVLPTEVMQFYHNNVTKLGLDHALGQEIFWMPMQLKFDRLALEGFLEKISKFKMISLADYSDLSLLEEQNLVCFFKQIITLFDTINNKYKMDNFRENYDNLKRLLTAKSDAEIKELELFIKAKRLLVEKISAMLLKLGVDNEFLFKDYIEINFVEEELQKIIDERLSKLLKEEVSTAKSIAAKKPKKSKEIYKPCAKKAETKNNEEATEDSQLVEEKEFKIPDTSSLRFYKPKIKREVKLEVPVAKKQSLLSLWGKLLPFHPRAQAVGTCIRLLSKWFLINSHLIDYLFVVVV